MQIHAALLESIALGILARRRTAMENATKKRPPKMNRPIDPAVQPRPPAAITKELMEIVGGAEALKG